MGPRLAAACRFRTRLTARPLATSSQQRRPLATAHAGCCGGGGRGGEAGQRKSCQRGAAATGGHEIFGSRVELVQAQFLQLSVCSQFGMNHKGTLKP